MCSPLCSFCEENYNVKRKGGREEHYILNSLREIIAKPALLPLSSPSLLGFSEFLPPLESGEGPAVETAAAGGPDKL